MDLHPTPPFPVHPLGDPIGAAPPGQDDTFPILTPGGIFHVRYEVAAEVSDLGGLVPFTQFLKVSGLFEGWVDEAPLEYAGNRAHGARDVLGTAMLAAISGHYRFAHIAGLRGDTVVPSLLGMATVVSDDTVRRGLKRLIDDSKDSTIKERTMMWARRHLRKPLDSLLRVPWTLDIDVTIKPVYGFHKGSVVGYNPLKPGRPSHALHSFVMAQTRLVLDVAVHPGNEHTPDHTLKELQRVLGDLARELWPKLLRGDCAYGNEEMMCWSENQQLHYLFKQKMTKYTKRLVSELDLQSGWVDVGHGWEGKESTLQLSTWSRSRRVVVLRRPDQGHRYLRASDLNQRSAPKQLVIDTCEPFLVEGDFEYQVLVTNLDEGITAIVNRYRDRADVENVFDEIKNHWGWGGFTSQTFEVTQLMAVLTATAYNWWSFFCRLADPKHHREAVTTRPTMLFGVVRQTHHGNQRTLTITPTHGEKVAIAEYFQRICRWMASLVKHAEQWPGTSCLESLAKAIFPGPLGVVSLPSG